MDFDINTILSAFGIIAAYFGGNFLGKRKIKNDFLTEMQANIDLLVSKNSELLKEVIALREENAQLLTNQTALKIEMKKMKQENNALLSQFTEFSQKLNHKKNEN